VPIALLTDFGSSDGYVGILKGVLFKIAPNAAVIDLAHDIPAYDRIHAGLVLYRAHAYFPRKTIFLTVIDPGVGGPRKPILIETEDYFFIGPDNGTFTPALAEQKIKRIIHLTEQKYFLQPPSSTFHGRDIFAPVAAHLAQGLAPQSFGPELIAFERLAAFIPHFTHEQIRGQILSIDRYGNAVTNLSRPLIQRHFPSLQITVQVQEQHIQGIKDHYAEADRSQPVALFGSSNLLEISVDQNSAAALLGLKRGDEVKVSLK